jgi:hypothetical protein
MWALHTICTSYSFKVVVAGAKTNFMVQINFNKVNFRECVMK